MKTFFRFLLWFLILSMFSMLVVVLALLLNYSLFAGIITAGLLVGLLLLVIFGWRLIRRYRAKRQIKNLIQTENEKIAQSATEAGSSQVQTTTNQKFKEFYQLLKRSKLNKNSAVLHQLPWYMVIGRQGAGKSSAIQRADLPAPFFQIEHSPNSANFCPYNQGILIDTPGFYLRDTHQIDKDAKEFLKLLAKQRASEPLSGIIVALDAEFLQNSEDTALVAEAKKTRFFIDYAQEQLRADLPIYLLITKCDQIPGFSDWANLLPSSCLNQPIGYLYRQKTPQTDFLNKALHSILDRIKNTILLSKSLNQNDFSLLQLTQQLEQIQGRLVRFAKRAFQANPYQEPPVLRGVFLSSAVEVKTEQKSSPSVFLQQLFTDILPKDRQDVFSLERILKRESAVNRRFFVSWGLAFACLLVFLITTFSGYRNYLQGIQKNYAGTFAQYSEFEENIKSMNSLRLVIQEVDAEVQSWWVPWLEGYRQPEFLGQLKQVFVSRFRETLLKMLDAKLKTAVQQTLEQAQQLKLADPKASKKTLADQPNRTRQPLSGIQKEQLEKNIGLYTDLLLRRIKMLEDFASGQITDSLYDYANSFVRDSVYFDPPLEPENSQLLHYLYVDYLYWNPDSNQLNEELNTLNKELVKILGISEDISWIVSLTNANLAQNPDTKIKNYWLGTSQIDPSYDVPRAFTLEGKAFIDNLLAELSSDKLSELPQIQFLQNKFSAVYQKLYLEAWQNFALNFDLGMQTLLTQEEWADQLDLLITANNPYARALNVIEQQLAPFADVPGQDWIVLVDQYQKAQNFSENTPVEEGKSNNKTFTKLALQITKKLGPLGKQVAKLGKQSVKLKKKLSSGQKKPSGTKSESELAAALEKGGKALEEHQKALQDIVFNAQAADVAFQMVKALYENPQNPGNGDNPLSQAYLKLQELEALFGKENRLNRPFWQLLKGSVRYSTRYMEQATACWLQKKWENDFLADLATVPKENQSAYIFNATDGKLWDFVNEEVKPFVDLQYRKGYSPVQLAGHQLPFSQFFLDYLASGTEYNLVHQDIYKIKFTTLPTSVNANALAQPRMTRLVLQCAQGDQALENYNYPASKSFEYREDCGTVSLLIQIDENITLQKQIIPPNAFAKFLELMKYGSYRFPAAEFPEHEFVLDSTQIEYINIAYKISGQDNLLKALSAESIAAPKHITQCWSS